MLDYEKFFSPDSIIKALCQQRMLICRENHEKEFFERYLPSKSSKYRTSKQDIFSLMPPRSRWKRANKHKRKQAKNSHFQNSKDLQFTVTQLRNENAPQDRGWIYKQDELVTLIQNKALADNKISIDFPKVIPIPKDKSRSEYRVLTSYKENLADSILIGLCANYLRQTFDDYFLDCSFAFRSPSNRQPPNHHDAFAQLALFWKNHQTNNQITAYVAECDIQGFFDTISHDVVLSCYDEAVREHEKSGCSIDKRAREVIVAYLKSYSYKNYGRLEALDVLQEDSSSSKVKDRDKTLGGCPEFCVNGFSIIGQASGLQRGW